MFFDIGSLKFLVLLILAILLFGPDKLPKLIQDAAGFLRKVRDYSDNAKRDIRSELGPEFKDFEFEDLQPKRFAQKHLMERDDLGLKQLRDDLDVRKELTEVSDAVNGRAPRPKRPQLEKGSGGAKGAGGGAAGSATAAPPAPSVESASPQISLDKPADGPPAASAPARDLPPFDSDAT